MQTFDCHLIFTYQGIQRARKMRLVAENEREAMSAAQGASRGYAGEASIDYFGLFDARGLPIFVWPNAPTLEKAIASFMKARHLPDGESSTLPMGDQVR